MDGRLVCLVAFVIASAVPYIKANENATVLKNTFTRSDCGKTKLCVEKPTQCDPSGASGCFFVSTRINTTDLSLTIELSGNSSGYIAVAAGLQSNVSQGSNIVFVCGNNNSMFFFQTRKLSNTTQLTAELPINVNNIQYSLNQSSLIQCAFTIPINSNYTDALSNFGINTTTFSKSANTTSVTFIDVFTGSFDGSVLGEPKSAFNSSFSVKLGDVNSSSVTNPTASPTVPTTITMAAATTKSGGTSLFSQAALILIAAVSLRFL